MKQYIYINRAIENITNPNSKIYTAHIQSKMKTQKLYIRTLTPELIPCTINVKVLRTSCYKKANMPVD